MPLSFLVVLLALDFNLRLRTDPSKKIAPFGDVGPIMFAPTDHRCFEKVVGEVRDPLEFCVSPPATTAIDGVGDLDAATLNRTAEEIPDRSAFPKLDIVERYCGRSRID